MSSNTLSEECNARIEPETPCSAIKLATTQPYLEGGKSNSSKS